MLISKPKFILESNIYFYIYGIFISTSTVFLFLSANNVATQPLRISKVVLNIWITFEAYRV